MLSNGSGGQPRGARRLVQAGCDLESGTSGLRFRRAPLLALLLAGCSSLPASMNPVSWWHDLQGGKIAEERPPPPGADQPYPNLASVPPKPEAPDRAALANIATALIADRTNAQHAAAAAPIADPSLPSASPALFGRGTVPPPPPPPPPGTGQASATMAAADAPPAAAAPPSQPANPPAAAAAAGQGPDRHGAERATRSAGGGDSERAACCAWAGSELATCPARGGSEFAACSVRGGGSERTACSARGDGSTACRRGGATARLADHPAATAEAVRCRLRRAPSAAACSPGGRTAADGARNRCRGNPGDTASAQRSQHGQRNVRKRLGSADVNRYRHAEAARHAEGDRRDRCHWLRRRRVG